MCLFLFFVENGWKNLVEKRRKNQWKCSYIEILVGSMGLVYLPTFSLLFSSKLSRYLKKASSRGSVMETVELETVCNFFLPTILPNCW